MNIIFSWASKGYFFTSVKIVVQAKKYKKKLNLWTSFCISWCYNNSLSDMPLSTPVILFTPTLLIFDNPFYYILYYGAVKIFPK